MARRRRLRDAPRELTLQLDSVAELFAPPRLDDHGGTASLASGIERLVTRLRSLPDEHRPRVVVVVPAHEVTDGAEAQTRASIARFCDARSEELRLEREAQVRDGREALWIGLPILFLGLFLIEAIRRFATADVLTNFFADGLLLVLAWVAVWYPLDTLLYYGRSGRQERRAVERLRRLEVVLRAAERPVPEG
jgi:hypothetical protein